MSQKVFRDCLGLKRIIQNVKVSLASFEPGLKGCWAVVVGTLYATFFLED